MDDPAGVVGFCQRVRPRLVGTLGLLCGDRDVGEELAQESWRRTTTCARPSTTPSGTAGAGCLVSRSRNATATRTSPPTGAWSLVRGCSHALWDLEAGRWVKIRDAPRNGQGRMVAAGPVFLIAGATNESSANGLVAYHP